MTSPQPSPPCRTDAEIAAAARAKFAERGDAGALTAEQADQIAAAFAAAEQAQQARPGAA